MLIDPIYEEVDIHHYLFLYLHFVEELNNDVIRDRESFSCKADGKLIAEQLKTSMVKVYSVPQIYLFLWLLKISDCVVIHN